MHEFSFSALLLLCVVVSTALNGSRWKALCVGCAFRCCCPPDLYFGDGALIDPSLDGLQGVDGIDNPTQSRIRLKQIALYHVVHVVGNAGKVNIGPGKLIEMKLQYNYSRFWGLLWSLPCPRPNDRRCPWQSAPASRDRREWPQRLGWPAFSLWSHPRARTRRLQFLYIKNSRVNQGHWTWNWSTHCSLLRRKSLMVSTTMSICKSSQGVAPQRPTVLARKRAMEMLWCTRFPSTSSTGIWPMGIASQKD